VFLIGSHLDTVPGAGRYDGVLGVLLGVAAVRLLGGTRLPFAIDVMAFSEEEGVRYGVPYLGSRAVADRFDLGQLRLSDKNGITMADAFRSFGLDPARVHEAAYPAGSLLGYLEPHIEQGPALERLDSPVGVVEAIAGQSRLWIELRGEAGHAGTLPMEDRHDALAAAAELVLEAERLARGIAGLRATVGTLAVEHAAVNVVPGTVRLTIDVRHPSDHVRTAAIAELRARAAGLAARRGIQLGITREEHHAAVPADPLLSSMLAEAVKQAGHLPHKLAIGAGHDAAVMAAIAPMAMLFLRSPGGVSHNPLESVLLDDVTVALEVIMRFLELLAEYLAPSQDANRQTDFLGDV